MKSHSDEKNTQEWDNSERAENDDSERAENDDSFLWQGRGDENARLARQKEGGIAGMYDGFGAVGSVLRVKVISGSKWWNSHSIHESLTKTYWFTIDSLLIFCWFYSGKSERWSDHRSSRYKHDWLFLWFFDWKLMICKTIDSHLKNDICV